MDDALFAAIAAHLARHNQQPGPPPVERVWAEALRPLVPRRCRSCRALIAAEGDLALLPLLLASRRCEGCYLTEAA